MGVGGISTPDDVRAYQEAGAGVVQALTGFIYGGPSWPAAVQR
jgi:dihydroorotate dehydrogenase